MMARQCIESMDLINQEIAAWQAQRNGLDAKVDWQFTTEDARIKLKRLYPTFDE